MGVMCREEYIYANVFIIYFLLRFGQGETSPSFIENGKMLRDEYGGITRKIGD